MARKSKTPRRASGARNSESTAATESTNTNGAAADHHHDAASSPPHRQPTDWSKIGPDFEFTIRYPAEASSRKRKRGKERDTEPLSQTGPFGDELNTLYTVAPADVWEDTKRYRKFTSKKTPPYSIGEQEVFVHRRPHPPFTINMNPFN